jgi:Ca2+-binding RTX toxin-like protein
MYIPGTSDNDTLTGTNGNDHFDGGAGDDIFQGGLGDDYYIVNSDGDQVIEETNQGVDSVVASVNYTLSVTTPTPTEYSMV